MPQNIMIHTVDSEAEANNIDHHAHCQKFNFLLETTGRSLNNYVICQFCGAAMPSELKPYPKHHICF